MRICYVCSANHFDLVWRRPWDRDYRYAGGRWLSYRQLEALQISRNLDLAEAGEGAYVLEQSLSLRAYLERFPEERERIEKLYARGQFELLGAGEAIIDVNLCGIETMIRNLAGGLHYARELGMPPLTACHQDGFGSSAQFPQVIRGCGLEAVRGLSYCRPDGKYWRGLDGSVVLALPAREAGKDFHYDHCYHEPCRECRGAGCSACEDTGLDLPQNWYPPFDPPTAEDFDEFGVCLCSVRSEEMLPPMDLGARVAAWQARDPDTIFRFGTPRRLPQTWRAEITDEPPEAEVSSRVENNPVQTGCYVSRIRIKQLARRCEALFFGWETALTLTGGLVSLERDWWAAAARELPLFFFHDAITGTHQDDAYDELIERMEDLLRDLPRVGAAALGRAVPEVVAGQTVSVFNPNAGGGEQRIPLGPVDWRSFPALVAVTPDGRRFPVLCEGAGDQPPYPDYGSWRRVVSVGPGTRTRPPRAQAWIEARDLPPLAWTPLQIEAAKAAIFEADARQMANEHLEVALGENGVRAVRDRRSGAVAAADGVHLGELRLEEDEGDPWGTRKPCSWQRELGAFTRLLGVRRGDGYQEAVYAGLLEPNLPFGREWDPAVFGLAWYVTVRLVDGCRRLDFDVEVFWKSCNRRLRVLFPVGAAADDGGVHGIPGGWLRRAPYEQTETCLWSGNGDWPALTFVAANGWAAVNHGTPSVRVQDGRLEVSVLRSPGFAHCLERYAQTYPMPTNGIRDNGHHRFHVSLTPAPDPAATALAASALNQAPPVVAGAFDRPAPLRLRGEGIELLAVKAPFRGPGTILHLLNQQDRSSVANLDLPPGTVQLCDLMEDPIDTLDATDGHLRLEFGPFEIRALRLLPESPHAS